ncbi:MAG: DUF1902 domain-containing protein [Citrobacter amalonaticus]|nr:DUF1902 domain-containing protein [Citrobacter amalonaticus]
MGTGAVDQRRSLVVKAITTEGDELMTKKFTVTVTRNDDIWIASCDAMGLTTEEKSYENLMFRTWMIAAELSVDNGLRADGEAFTLVFAHEVSSGDPATLLRTAEDVDRWASYL